jgi:hypothetical protein
MKRSSRKTSETRELTDKELGEITSAMGDNVRSLSKQISNLIQANLKAEFAARRNNPPTLITSSKPVAA